MLVQPYLFFDGRCEEAIEFYKRAVGAEVTALMRNKDAPEAPPPGTLPPGSENKIMHSSFRIGETVVMASDGHCKGKPVFTGFSLTITVPDDARQPTGCSARWATADRCRCRSRRHSSPRASGWSPIASVCRG